MSLYGLMAEFETEEEVRRAAVRVYNEGYRSVDAFSPYPVEGLSDAVGFSRTRMPLIILIGGISGCAGGYLLQYWAMVLSYPFNIGGRPLHSWPAFIPVTFEMTILFAALAGFFGVLAANHFPELYHPVFNVPAFKRASSDRFFLCIREKDRVFDLQKTRHFLESLNPTGVYDVPA